MVVNCSLYCDRIWFVLKNPFWLLRHKPMGWISFLCININVSDVPRWVICILTTTHLHKLEIWTLRCLASVCCCVFKGFPDCYLISVMFVGNSVLLIGKGEKVGVCASAFAISDFLQYTWCSLYFHKICITSCLYFKSKMWELLNCYCFISLISIKVLLLLATLNLGLPCLVCDLFRKSMDCNRISHYLLVTWLVSFLCYFFCGLAILCLLYMSCVF